MVFYFTFNAIRFVNFLIMNLQKLLFFSFFSFFVLKANAQFFPIKNYPQHYFIWPVKSPIGIVANFGEMRPNHFHMGLDCQTSQGENATVVAAADGYICRVNIDANGFGRAIYISHPNGLTTLYAHLNKFFPELEAYVREQQYKLQKWAVNLEIPANLFLVKQGQFIAKSGNTGGSQGPHLHFEIRDTKSEKVLNPLLFGLPIKDNVKPVVTRLAIYDRRSSTYEQVPLLFNVKKVNGIYVPMQETITVHSDKVSFAVSATDSYTGSSNPNGIYSAILYDNNQPVTGFQLDSISYDETRYLNAHIDYKTKMLGGPFLQHLTRLPGYITNIYKTNMKGDGLTYLEDKNTHVIKIEISDANGNSSLVVFKIKKSDEPLQVIPPKSGKLFVPDHVNIFDNEKISVHLPENFIYDTFYFVNSSSSINSSTIYSLSEDYIPVHQYFPISIKEHFADKDTGKIVMKQSANGKIRFRKANFSPAGYTAYFRDFGNYQLIVDTLPPKITALVGFKEGAQWQNKNTISFSVKDNTETIKDFTATLDGNWVLFTNDKEKDFIYTVDKYCPPGEHILKIIVKDLAGNSSEELYHFKN